MGGRRFVLRQAGLLELSIETEGAPSTRVALLDGAVDLSHPAFDGCAVSRMGDARSARAGDHATFCASILTASTETRRSGRALGICSGSGLLNLSCVTDTMLDGETPAREVGEALARAVGRALDAGCHVIVFGLEPRNPTSPDWRPLRESILAAAKAGCAVVMPAGNRAGAHEPAGLGWPGTLVVASRDWRGRRSVFSPRSGLGDDALLAPGENLPGAGPRASFVVRSGTSFAACVVGAALGLARSASPDHTALSLVGDICAPPHRILNATAFFKHHFPYAVRGRAHVTCNDGTFEER